MVAQFRYCNSTSQKSKIQSMNPFPHLGSDGAEESDFFSRAHTASKVTAAKSTFEQYYANLKMETQARGARYNLVQFFIITVELMDPKSLRGIVAVVFHCFFRGFLS